MSHRGIKIGGPIICPRCGQKKMRDYSWLATAGRLLALTSVVLGPIALLIWSLLYFVFRTGEEIYSWLYVLAFGPWFLGVMILLVSEAMPKSWRRYRCANCDSKEVRNSNAPVQVFRRIIFSIFLLSFGFGLLALSGGLAFERYTLEHSGVEIVGTVEQVKTASYSRRRSHSPRYYVAFDANQDGTIKSSESEWFSGGLMVLWPEYQVGEQVVVLQDADDSSRVDLRGNWWSNVILYIVLAVIAGFGLLTLAFFFRWLKKGQARGENK